jgi:hypothetical protein
MPERNYSLSHEDYTAQLPTWLEAYDFYRGGAHVLEPGRDITKFGFIISRLEDGSDVEKDPSRNRRRARFERVPVQSYLWSHINEDLESYSDRTARATHVPLLRHIADTYVSAALRRAPTRAPGMSMAPWSDYAVDVDRRGTNLDAFIRQAMGYALAFGLEFAITDRPRFDGPARNRAEQLARGERAYSYLVHPMDLINWRVEPNGELSWIIVREDAPDERIPGDEMPEQRPQRYRIWYRDRWELFEEAKQDGDRKFMRVAEGGHPVGEVPLAVFYARRGEDARKPLCADSMLADLVRLDRRFYNAMSVADEILCTQGFSQTFIPEDRTGVAAPITLGPGRYVSYNSENGTPIQLSPPAEHILAHLQYMTHILQLAKETAGVGRGKAEHSKEERSAEALLVESRNENNRIVALVESAENFEETLLRHVAAWEATEAPASPNYSRDVSLRSLSRQINDALQLKQLGVPVEAMKQVIKPLVAQHMQEQGLSRKDVKAAEKAVDGMVEQVVRGEPIDEAA